jgi:hypothetical protein
VEVESTARPSARKIEMQQMNVILPPPQAVNDVDPGETGLGFRFIQSKNSYGGRKREV